MFKIVKSQPQWKSGSSSMAHPGFFSGRPETPPPTMIFLIYPNDTLILAPTFNRRDLETPRETNSGYATALIECITSMFTGICFDSMIFNSLNRIYI